MPRINWYSLFKNILVGPFLRVWNRPTQQGIEHIPASGPALLASNHQSVFDSFYLCLLCPRRITYLSKKEYFTGKGLVGGFQRWFFTAVGQVPIDRTSSDSAQAAIDTGIRLLKQGHLLGIYPEGTRSPDGRLYKAKTGAARVAIAAGVKVVPIAMLNTRKANPIGSWFLRPVHVSMVVGEPIDPVEFLRSRGLEPDAHDYKAARALADEIIAQIAKLSGQDYVDVYAQDVKDSLARGEGYPPAAQPHHS